jgi:hypothetical protein
MLSALLGLIIPTKLSAKAYLRQRLKEVGFEMTRFPQESLEEIFQWIIDLNEFTRGSKNELEYKSQLVNSIKGNVSLIMMHIENPEYSYKREKISKTKEPMSEIVDRYSLGTYLA